MGVALAQVRPNIIHTHKKKVRRTILAVRGAFYRVGVAKNGFFLPLRGGWGGGNDSKIFANQCFFKTRLGIYSQKFYQPMCFGSPQGVRGLLKRPSCPFLDRRCLKVGVRLLVQKCLFSKLVFQQPLLLRSALGLTLFVLVGSY